MHKTLPILLLLPLLGCLDDDDVQLLPEEAALSLNFRAEYDGAPLGIQRETYAYPTEDSLKVLLFQYYVSDLEALPADGSPAVMLSEIDLIRYMSATDDATVERRYTLPTGEYWGLRFGLGVKPTLNATDPSNFAADFVLNEAEFWGPETRYVFAKIEANAALEDDGRFDTGLSYHMGADSLYTTLELNRPFTILASEDNEITVVTDVLGALSGGGETFDITDPQRQAIHGGNQGLGAGIWSRLAGQFRLATP